jgi:ATP adenylyltransferase
MEYLRQTGEAEGKGGETECLFCGLAEREPSSENLVLERYERTFLVLNAFPYTSGHLMVAPYRHHDSLLGQGSQERSEILAALERGRGALGGAYSPQGFNLGANLGRSAGAGVIGHVHWHLVPRWQGDTNFMPVLAETRVLPEALPETYRQLLDALSRVPESGLRVVGKGHVP